MHTLTETPPRDLSNSPNMQPNALYVVACMVALVQPCVAGVSQPPRHPQEAATCSATCSGRHGVCPNLTPAAPHSSPALPLPDPSRGSCHVRCIQKLIQTGCKGVNPQLGRTTNPSPPSPLVNRILKRSLTGAMGRGGEGHGRHEHVMGRGREAEGGGGVKAGWTSRGWVRGLPEAAAAPHTAEFAPQPAVPAGLAAVLPALPACMRKKNVHVY